MPLATMSGERGALAMGGVGLSSGRLDCFPHGVRDFGLGDVAVRARRAVAVLDDARRLEVVDVSALELVGVRGVAHFQIVRRESGPLDAEGAQPSVLRELARSESNLQCDAGRHRIELADSGVALR